MASLMEAITIKRKMYFEFEGAPYHCLEVEVSKPTARGGQTLVRIKMRNLLTRAVFDKTFKAGEKFKEPDLAMVPASYLYSGGDGHNFMDQETFDQPGIPKDIIGESAGFLQEGMECKLTFYEGKPLDIEMPTSVDLKVIYAEVAVRGDTATGVTKKVKVETGFEVQCPNFVKEGDTIRVDTRTGEYLTRV